jgi:hypothetical protein
MFPPAKTKHPWTHWLVCFVLLTLLVFNNSLTLFSYGDKIYLGLSDHLAIKSQEIALDLKYYAIEDSVFTNINLNQLDLSQKVKYSELLIQQGLVANIQIFKDGVLFQKKRIHLKFPRNFTHMLEKLTIDSPFATFTWDVEFLKSGKPIKNLYFTSPLFKTLDGDWIASKSKPHYLIPLL